MFIKCDSGIMGIQRGWGVGERRLYAACTAPSGYLTFTITGNVFSDNNGKMFGVHAASFILHKGSHTGTQVQALATDITCWSNVMYIC